MAPAFFVLCSKNLITKILPRFVASSKKQQAKVTPILQKPPEI